jgi:hypothetical protein
VGDERFTSHDESYLYLFRVVGQGEKTEKWLRSSRFNEARISARLLLLEGVVKIGHQAPHLVLQFT